MPALAEAEARKLLKTLNAKNPDRIRDIESIANAIGLIVEETETENSDGYSLRNEYSGLIKVSKYSKQSGQRRFTIAHEIGHFLLDKEPVHICKIEDMVGYKSKKADEDKANAFAVEFLMKKKWYEDFVKDKDPGIKTIREAAEYFGVSLTASAIRYPQVENFPDAVIISRRKHGGQVLWPAISESFPYQYIPIDYPVIGSSEATRSFMGEQVDTKPHDVLADSWFLNDFNFRRD